MGAGTSKIPDLNNLSTDQLVQLQTKIIPELIKNAKESEAKPTSPTSPKSAKQSPAAAEEDVNNEARADSELSALSPTGGGKKRRKKTKKHRKKRMKKTGKK